MKYRCAAIALVCASVAFAADGFAQSQPAAPAPAKPATPATTGLQPLTSIGTPATTGTATVPADEPKPFTNDWKAAPKAAAVDPRTAEMSAAYQIGPEDLLDISVWKNVELSRVVPVRPDGKVSLPLVNDIQAAGLTPTQLRDQITTKLAE